MEKQNEEIEFEDLQALIKKTDKENPKPEDMKLMRRLLDKNSSLIKINELSELAVKRVIETISTSALSQELLRRQIEEKREELNYNSASLMERMLIDQIILCHVRLNNIEMLHAAKTYERHSSEHGLYWDKRLNSAQKRFTQACESLAKVRKHLAEANLRDQQAETKRRQATLLSTQIYKNISD